MGVDVAAAFRTKYHEKNNNLPGSPLAFYPESYYLIIRLPISKILNLFTRLLLLALVVASLPRIGSFIGRSSSAFTQAMSNPAESDYDSLSIFFRDLTNEGLMNKSELKAVFLSNENEDSLYESQILADNNMELVMLNDLVKQSTISNESIDFVFTFNFPKASQFIDRTLKTGGVAAILMNDNPSDVFYKPLNYKIAYLRRFGLTAVAMKKTRIAEERPPTQRKLLAHASEAKKAALQKLEDVLLEPPRATSKKSSRYLKRTRYLPDLMGDSLESYPRRVFIDVGLPEKEGGSGIDWFPENYPTRNKNFEIYKIETVTESSGKEVSQIGMSEWLRKNVKDEEYVVMKAEAELVEEMIKSKAIRLVDELFLECKPQLGHNQKQGNFGKHRKNRRAYWECLALYGKLRDEGVAVHQWWG
ncbi:hypothetical protein L6164_030660 [Bauhinia variegata]|uniref:Uncharacterized protein n=1 Tax=Bauhinia variegata TaxID=167791 RepID=A0ACB9LD16_BAUVA|nr:hypothetical protein L6164_030660 [Bauhinia variegata]